MADELGSTEFVLSLFMIAVSLLAIIGYALYTDLPCKICLFLNKNCIEVKSFSLEMA